MDSRLSKDVSEALDIFSMEGRVKDIFIPLLTNSKLKLSFTELSKESPIFQKSLVSLNESFLKEEFGEFLRRYLEFYQNISIVSEELSVILENTFSKIEDIKIPLSVDEKTEYLSSKSFLGSMIFLLITSNDDVFTKSLNRLGSAL